MSVIEAYLLGALSGFWVGITTFTLVLLLSIKRWRRALQGKRDYE